MSLELCTNVFSCARILGQNLHSFARALALAVSTTSSGCVATQSRKKNGLLKSMMKLDSDFLRGSSWDSRRTVRSTQHSVPANPGRDTKERGDIAGPTHLGALIAAKPRILAMIQDAVTAGFLPKQPLESRLATVIETTSKPSMTSSKAAQAVDEALQQQLKDTTDPSFRTR